MPAGSNPRRAFCHDAHKQAYSRQQHQQDQTAALVSEVEELRAKVVDLAQEIELLRFQLAIERRYLEDTTPRYFRAWLRKQPSSPWRERFLSNQLVPARGTRSHYEAHVR